MASPARLRLVLAALVGLLAALLATPAPAAHAAGDKGIVNGNVICPKLAKCPNLKLLWFDKSWSYLGQKKANGGGYSLTLAPGTYHLQFVDQRPAYDVTKFAPTDVKVTVRANDLTARNVTMEKGAAITGTVKNGAGKPLKKAKVVAARTDGTSFSTQGNGQGQFAVGGLPPGKYSIFTFDPQKTWVDKSTWAGGLDHGQKKNFAIKLKKRAGNLTVYLFQPQGLLKTKTTLTVTSKATGQWWSAKSGNGTFVFRGVYPGQYKAQFNGAGVWFAKTGAVQKGKVVSGRMAFGDFHLTKRGGWLTGHIVDGDGREMVPLRPGYTNGPGATIKLFDKGGHQVAVAESDDEGKFKLTGQLATQDGMTIVVEPPSETGFYMWGEARCQFDRAEFDGYSLRTGQESYIGQLPVPRTPDQAGVQCATLD